MIIRIHSNKSLIRLVGLLGLCLLPIFLHAQTGPSTYQVPAGLVRGGSFIDLFLPVPLRSELTSRVWGAPNVLPRDAANGIEDAEYSYWGGKIIHGQDGKEHLFVCRWLESNPKGHSYWSRSEVVHAVSDSPLGPYQVVSVLGKGHNPEIYQLKDGTYLVGVIGAAYKSASLYGPWERIETVLNCKAEPLNKTNKTYILQDDGSILMMNKNGYVFLSEKGDENFTQITEQSVYPPIKNHFEDPVIWKDEVQYHLIVNDWYTRTALYLRSPDGIHWTWDPGIAFDPSIMRHEDGSIEAWHKFERPKVRQDQYGRATHMNFAVIDVEKDLDQGGDNHSSKNIVIPLVVSRRLVILNPGQIGIEGSDIRVKISAEAGFDPLKEVDLSTLRFGAPNQVDFGHGCTVSGTEIAGSDLIVIFSGRDHGLTANDFAAKLLGRTKQDGLLFGYAKVPTFEIKTK